MSFSERYVTVARKLLPMPFTIAVLLTALTFIIALLFTESKSDDTSHVMQLFQSWEAGLWNGNLMIFAMQMMLMLVLGHALALTRPIGLFIDLVVTKMCRNTASAAAAITFFTCIVAFFNWGLGLIFGAIIARKTAEFARKNNLQLNYPIIGAAGYSGLMVWHGGLSGSSLAKVAEPGHLHTLMKDQPGFDGMAALPEAITFAETVFSPMNLVATALLLLILPTVMYALGRKNPSRPIILPSNSFSENKQQEEAGDGAERLDRAMAPALIFGALILGLIFYKIFVTLEGNLLKFFTPNNINFLLLGLGLLLHGSFSKFLKGVDEAISGASGILIQFPLYFGIMGIMTSSGLVNEISSLFVERDLNSDTFSLTTFVSAGVVNVFVPSGGGQWAVQGPIIVQSATELNIPLGKSIMALAYGDQLTNMLQPFWALPLLGITGLKAKDILPYTLLLMFVGAAIFTVTLVIF